MYTRLLRKSEHTKTFTISHDQREGWQVSEEEDGRLVLSVCYRDWHRVERAVRMFAEKARALHERGWVDHVVTVMGERPLGRASTAFLSREPAHKF